MKKEQLHLLRENAGKRASVANLTGDAKPTVPKLQASKTPLLADKPAFSDPRSSGDRRQRKSIFFSTFRDRRSRNRRGVCSLHTNWWTSRNYCEEQSRAAE